MSNAKSYELDLCAASASCESVRVRCEAVSLRLQGWTIQDAAEEVGCSEKSVSRWSALFERGGIELLCEKRIAGRRPIVSPERVREVEFAILHGQRRTTPARGEDLREALASRGISISVSSVYTLLHRLHFSYQSCRPVHPRRNEVQARQWKDDFAGVVESLRQKHPDRTVRVWFQDETRFGMKGILTRQWSKVGMRPTRERQVEYANAWIFGAVAPETGQQSMLVTTHAATDFMQLFLNNFSRQLGRGVHALLVLDNAGWHRTPDLRVPDNITLHFLPPYCPDLNPIENLWLFMKSRFLCNRVFGSLSEILRAGVRACESLTKEICRSVCARNYVTT